jgi:hypothetical protein
MSLKTSVEPRVSEVVRMWLGSRSPAPAAGRVVRVAWVVAGRIWGFGRWVEGGMEIVRVAVARWQSQRRGRRMDMIGVRECECTGVVLKWKFTYGVIVLVWRWKLEVS